MTALPAGGWTTAWGAYTVLHALLRARDKGARVGVYAATTTGEETTMRGAFHAASRVKPSLAIAVDVIHTSDFSGSLPQRFGEIKLGGGPVLCVSSVCSAPANRTLEETARRMGLSVQYEVASGVMGTDADKMNQTNGGTPVTTVSIPLRYMHSPSEGGLPHRRGGHRGAAQRVPGGPGRDLQSGSLCHLRERSMQMLLLTNGTIATMDPARPLAQAAVVEGDYFAYVGSAGEAEDFVREFSPGGWETLDLRGRFVLPGFNDSHLHFIHYVKTKLSVDLFGAASLAEVQERLRRGLAGFDGSGGRWLLGEGWTRSSSPTCTASPPAGSWIR